jgi:hypothetical protein
MEERVGMTPSEARPATSVVDRWLSIAAAIGALCAVAISLYQAALSREQQRASAWPYLAQSNSYVPAQPYTRDVANEGVGPARIRSFEVLVDGRPVRSWSAAVRTLTGKTDSGLVYSSLRRGSVLPPGSSRTLLRIPPGEQARAFWEAAQSRLETVICYCSIYDECWVGDTRTAEPAAVRTCTADTTAAFAQ